MTMEAVDTRTHTGFWPLKHDQKECGFEYFCDAVDRQTFELEGADDFLELIGNRDCSVTFTWHGSLDDCRAASFAAGVLAKLSDGVLLDPQSGETVVGRQALELVKKQDRTERDMKMEQAMRKWSQSTSRRCPTCNAPCPEYRPTCFVCGDAIGRA